MPKITFNSQEYDSPDDMPPEVRQLYDLAMGIVSATGQEGLRNAVNSTQATVLHTTQLVVDGKVYNSIEELPPDIRERYLKAMQPLDANQNGIPDMLEDGAFAGFLSAVSPERMPDAPAQAQPNLVTVVGEGPKVSATLLIAGVVILILLGALVFLLMGR